MNFYIAKYKRQVFNGKEWKDTEYNSLNILVAASAHCEAAEKVEKCLHKAERGIYRGELVGGVRKCVGIVFGSDPDGCQIKGIVEN